ncbi:MAG TPA: hypothetical protein VGD78_09805 [Chthoniobacterales bacterium]
MEPEKSPPPLSAGERLAKDVRQEAALLRNLLHFSLWTLVALIPTMLLLLVDMPPFWRVITGVLCAGFWMMAIGGMFRMTGLLDSGRRSVSLNPFHAGKAEDKHQTNK